MAFSIPNMITFEWQVLAEHNIGHVIIQEVPVEHPARIVVSQSNLNKSKPLELPWKSERNSVRNFG